MRPVNRLRWKPMACLAKRQWPQASRSALDWNECRHLQGFGALTDEHSRPRTVQTAFDWKPEAVKLAASAKLEELSLLGAARVCCESAPGFPRLDGGAIGVMLRLPDTDLHHSFSSTNRSFGLSHPLAPAVGISLVCPTWPRLTSLNAPRPVPPQVGPLFLPFLHPAPVLFLSLSFFLQT